METLIKVVFPYKQLTIYTKVFLYVQLGYKR